MKRSIIAICIALTACQPGERRPVAKEASKIPVDELGNPTKQPDGSPLTAAFCGTEEADRIYDNIKTCSMVACDQGDEASCKIAQTFATQHAPQNDTETDDTSRPATVTIPGDYSGFTVSETDVAGITSADYQRCMGKAHYNSEMAQCIRDEWDHVDKLLNSNYRAAISKMSNQRAREQLRTAQRQWLRDSEEQCNDELETAGHTPYELALHQCQIDELIRRVAWLRRLARS